MGSPAGGLAVLAGVPVEGRHHGDALGGGPLGRVDHDELLHDGVVDGAALPLGVGPDDEGVAAPDRLAVAHLDLAVGEVLDVAGAQLDAELGAHARREGLARPPRHDAELLLGLLLHDDRHCRTVTGRQAEPSCGCWPGRTRTCNIRSQSPTFYQLNYRPSAPARRRTTGPTIASPEAERMGRSAGMRVRATVPVALSLRGIAHKEAPQAHAQEEAQEDASAHPPSATQVVAAPARRRPRPRHHQRQGSEQQGSAWPVNSPERSLRS